MCLPNRAQTIGLETTTYRCALVNIHMNGVSPRASELAIASPTSFSSPFVHPRCIFLGKQDCALAQLAILRAPFTSNLLLRGTYAGSLACLQYVGVNWKLVRRKFPVQAVFEIIAAPNLITDYIN